MVDLIFYSLKEKRVNIDSLFKSKEAIGLIYVDLAGEIKEVAIFAGSNKDFIVMHEDWGIRTVDLEKVQGLWYDYLGINCVISVKEVASMEIHLI